MALAQRPGNAVAMTTTSPPNTSLYIKNLPEKLQKHDLKRNLYMLFSTYGPVLDVNVMKTSKMRGQSHVLFRDQQSATQALRNCQGFDFFGKEISISYSKNRSHTLAKLTGTFVDPAETTSAPSAGPGSKDAPSSFPAPPGATTGLPPPPGSGLPPPPGLPQKPNGQLQTPASVDAENAASPAVSAGTKRQRDESDDEDGDAPMDEDSGGEMEMSDDD